MTILLFLPFFSGLCLAEEGASEDGTYLNQFTADIHKALDYKIKILQLKFGEDNKRYGYVIDAKYPELSGMTSSSGREKLNSLIKNRVMKEVRSFVPEARKAFARKERLEKKGEYQSNEEGFSSSLYIDYVALSAAPKIVSVLFDIETYLALRAHPTSRFFVVNYDLEKNASIKLASFFPKDTNYLKTLSGICKKDLVRQSSESDMNMDFIDEGVSPRPENFKNFGIAKDGIVIFFDVYQVAPYVEGPKKVFIPLK